MRPNVNVSAAGTSTISSACRKLESPLAFSSGIAELTLKKPPPTEPSVLIAAQVATGRSSDCTTPWVRKTSVATA